jgi:threonine dehydratase
VLVGGVPASLDFERLAMRDGVPEFADVLDAAERIKPYAVRTPLIEHPALNDRVGGRVLLKTETLQRVGAFKFRGAYNAVSRTDRGEFPGGVVACSSGTHAQGVAHAAALCELPAVIVMPRDAPVLKVERTKAFGAEVVLYDRETEDRYQIARELAASRGARFVPPFDDGYVIAGQGTAGLEIAEQARLAGATPDAVLVCTGGGGLLSGIALALSETLPGVKAHSVEPEGFDDFARSLAAGERLRNARMGGSICDALLPEMPGEKTFEIARRLCGEGIIVSDVDAAEAVRFAFFELKLVVEPGGAVALAALLSGAFDGRGRTVVATLSGGNVDPRLFARLIGAEAVNG